MFGGGERDLEEVDGGGADVLCDMLMLPLVSFGDSDLL